MKEQPPVKETSKLYQTVYMSITLPTYLQTGRVPIRNYIQVSFVTKEMGNILCKQNTVIFGKTSIICPQSVLTYSYKKCLL